MTARARHPPGVPRRLDVVVFALFLATSLVAAPLTHPESCTGACAGSAVADPTPGAAAGAPACHGAGGHQEERPGCACTDDCCSLLAQFVAAPAVSDAAAPALLAARTLPVRPDDARRAPAARLLPYPTGPPATL